MDKRKLMVGRTVTGTLNIYTTRSLKPFAYMSSGCDENYRELSEDDTHEIVKRWNEYPQQAERIAKLEEALNGIVDEIKNYGFIGVEGVSEHHENHWSGSPAMQEAIALLQTLKA